jgi:hypothetical protein
MASATFSGPRDDLSSKIFIRFASSDSERSEYGLPFNPHR